MIQVIEPEFYIKIGINENKVVFIDWDELTRHHSFLDINEVRIKVIDYLVDAIKLMNK